VENEPPGRRSGGTPVSATHALEMRSVSKIYRRRSGQVTGLGRLTLAIDPGETVALVGPNGAGKTTALRIAATLVEPTSGSAYVFGRDVFRFPLAARSALGTVFSSTRSFYWRLTAEHNLAFFGAAQGLSPRRARAAGRSVAAELGIAECLSVPARRLSRGVLARLALARALLHEPALLLLDEPFSAIDEAWRVPAWRSLERRVRKGLAVLLATHDPSLVERCERAVSVRAHA